MPGYCVQGTVGHKILNGQKKLEMEGRATVIIGSILHHSDTVILSDRSWLVNMSIGASLLEVTVSDLGASFALCPAGGEAAGGVHVVQRPRRCQGHHAADPHGRATQYAPRARRGQEDGVPQRQDRTGI